MIDGIDDFKSLMQRLGAGDKTAAEQIVNRYGDHLTHAIKRRLRSQKLRVRYATEDCLQSVWKSMLLNIDQVARIQTPEHLKNYLANAASNKLIDRDRQSKAQRNDVFRERYLPEPDSPGHDVLAVQDPTPSQIIAVDDEWEVLTKDVSADVKEILELSRQGYTSDEIAKKTNRKPRGIRKAIQKFRELVQRASDGESGRRPTDGQNGDHSGKSTSS